MKTLLYFLTGVLFLIGLLVLRGTSHGGAGVLTMVAAGFLVLILITEKES